MALTFPFQAALSRRNFLTLSAAASAALVVRAQLQAAPAPAAAPKQTPIDLPKPKTPPIGIELYAVRGELTKDLAATLRRVAKIGYQVVEFYSPYLGWTFPYAKDVRMLIDDLGLRCYSTHNGANALIDAGSMAKAIELNQILGSRYIIAASPPRGITGEEGWKRTADQFTAATEQMKSHGLMPGFHNHASEWKPVSEGGPRAMDILAANTPKEFVLQLDVGTAMEANADPVGWIKKNPGRIKVIHLKDWTPGKKEEEKSYRVLFGEGVTPWKELIVAAESVGGVEFYLMEQEGSRYSEFETAERCLATWKKMRRG
jgi:sugar phosphate isomerase/epimerase